MCIKVAIIIANNMGGNNNLRVGTHGYTEDDTCRCNDISRRGFSPSCMPTEYQKR